MPSAAEMVTTIEATLAQLYAKLHKSLGQKDRSATLQDIAVLEKSRDYWKKQSAIASGTKARCASIDMTGF
jgi:hypothetical protein